MGAVLVLLLVGLPIYLFFRWSGRANGWIYDTLNEFFRESLQGHRHQNSLARVFALLGSIILVVIIIALILMLTWKINAHKPHVSYRYERLFPIYGKQCTFFYNFHKIYKSDILWRIMYESYKKGRYRFKKII